MQLTVNDVAEFAEASGVNPLHVDETFAWRTSFGRTIAHGALAVVAGLAAAPEDRLWRATGLTARFFRPVLTGSTYRASSAGMTVAGSRFLSVKGT